MGSSSPNRDENQNKNSTTTQSANKHPFGTTWWHDSWFPSQYTFGILATGRTHKKSSKSLRFLSEKKHMLKINLFNQKMKVWNMLFLCKWVIFQVLALNLAGSSLRMSLTRHIWCTKTCSFPFVCKSKFDQTLPSVQGPAQQDLRRPVWKKTFSLGCPVGS